MKVIVSIVFAVLSVVAAYAGEGADTLFRAQRADTLVIVDNKTDITISMTVTDTLTDKRVSRQQSITVEPGGERVLIMSKSREKKPAVSQTRTDSTKTDSTKTDREFNQISITWPSSNRSRWDAIIGGLGYGMVNATEAPACMRHQMAKSWEVSMLYVLGVRYNFHKYTSINFGFGLTGRSLKIGDGMRYAAGESGVTAVPFPEGAVKTSADVYTFSIDLPLLLRQYLPIKLDGKNRMSVILGGILNFNTHASVSCKYKMPGDLEYKDKLEKSHHRAVTWQLMGGIYFNNWLGAYIKYMPVEPIKLDAISYKPLSVGLQVSF